MVHDFKQLDIWKLSHKLTLDVYKLTRTFPTDEKHGIVSQLRRASSSVPANIAEGCWKHTNNDFVHFLYISRGSLSESIYFLLLSRDLGYIDEIKYQQINEEYVLLSKLLNSFITSIKKQHYPIIQKTNEPTD